MQFPYKLVAFDLDGTLSPSKEKVSGEMAALLSRLSEVTKVVVISGGSFARFQEQVLSVLQPSTNIILLPAEGSERFEYIKGKWQLTDKEPFSKDLKKQVFKVLDDIINDPEFEVPPHPQGKYVEDRDTEVAFSALGQDAPLVEKEKWDPTRVRRFKIKAEIERRLPNVTAAVAGTTSIDILPRGFDKGKGLELLLGKLGIAKEDVLFVGDAVVPGGNDYAVLEAKIKTVQVSGPEDTMKTIRALLDGDRETADEGVHPLPKLPSNPVAYFCAEYALDVNPSMYAGGLGVLAGDYVLEAAEENYPFVAIGLKYGKSVPEGFGKIDMVIDVPIGEECVHATVFHKTFSSNVHVFLLSAGDITLHLYDSDFYTRIRQQMVLGIGGVRLIEKLGISPRIYHLNEGATAFAGVALMLERQKEMGKIVGTKHTILSEAGLLIARADIEKYLGPYIKQYKSTVAEVFEKGKFELSEELFSTTKCVMTLSVKKNAVSSLHAVFEKKRHPHSTLISITNGVYRKRWQAKEFLSRRPDSSVEDLLTTKRKLQKELFTYIESMTGKRLNPGICTLVWARRFAAYKRPSLLFTDRARLTTLISDPARPLQIVISGKAHDADAEGQDTVEKIIAFSNTKEVRGRVVYLPDYNITSAEKLTRGADIWLNTPELGKEACGTSGMKASLNGTLQCSIRDGWVDEANWEGRGWSLPEEGTAEALYDFLEHEILPMYYDDPEKWAMRMKSTLELVEDRYTTARMLDDYEKLLYS